MERWQVIALVIAAYLALTLTVGLLAGRRQSASVTGYVAGDRDFGLLVMYFVTGASVFSAFAFLGGPGWAYNRGAAAFYILSYGALGMFPFYWVGPRIARVGRRFGYVTQAQMLRGRFPSKALPVVVAVITLLASVPYVTLQMQGAGIVIEAVTDGHIPLAWGAAIAYGVVIWYVLQAGVMAVGWTNTFQGIFMLVMAWTLGLYLPFSIYGGVGPMFEGILAERPELLTLPGLTASGEPWTWAGYSSAILVSVIGLMMWPHLFMKAFTARSDRVLRRTVILFPTFQLFLIPVYLIGFSGVLFPESPADPDFILPFMVLRTGLPAIIVGLFCAGALSASMSTGDTVIHSAASVLVEDGLGPFIELTDAAQRRIMRLLVLVIGGVSYWLAISDTGSLVSLLLGAYGMICQLAPPVVAALYWKRATTAGVLWGLVLGTATAMFFVEYPDLRPSDMHEGIYGLLVNVSVLVGVSLLGRAQDEAHVATFFEAERAGATRAHE
jgi:SSS family solute:Na+ symporter